MSNLSNTTSDIHIEHPEYWTLLLELCPGRLRYMFYDVDQDNSLIAGDIALDLSAGSYLKALENAVYDNPVLLDDYKQVRVIVDSMQFVVLPPAYDDETCALDALDAAFPNREGDLVFCRLPRCQVGIACDTPQGVTGFLQRTFNMPPVVHHLYPLCEHYRRQDDNREVACVHLNLHDGCADMLITRNKQLVMANSYPLKAADDAVYYALHAWKTFGLDQQRDELLIAGDRDLTSAATATLRKYVSYVMPPIFPAQALKIGQDAMKAPLKLILLALCE